MRVLLSRNNLGFHMRNQKKAYPLDIWAMLFQKLEMAHVLYIFIVQL